MTAHVSDNRLVLDNGTEVVFARRVTQARKVGPFYVVIVDPPGDGSPLSAENVLGFDESGNLMWQVQAMDLPSESCYVGFEKRTDEVWLIHFSGFHVRVDPGTGRILDSKLMR